MITRKNFGAAPPGYVGGIGRGAVGFTTRSDIGPAQNDYNRSSEQPSEPSGLASYDESQFDKFSGYRQSLFAGAATTKEDINAEQIYIAIDQRMDSKRRSRREKLESKFKNITRDVYEQFQSHKRELATLTLEDWESIPSAGQQTKRPKAQRRAEKMTPVPDLIIHSAHESAVQNIDRSGTITPLATTPISSGTATPVNLTQLGSAREKVLDMTLGKLSDSVDGQTVVDPKGYLTDLRSRAFAEGGDVSDVEKARLLFKSITSTNPNSAPGWIGAARLEEHVGRLALARKLVLKGCDSCPDSEDIWIEAARLHDPKRSRAVVARALSFIPRSEKLWLRAVRLEPTRDAKRLVLRKALELIPKSVAIWRSAIDIEPQADARALLGKAVRCVPSHVEFWLALARLEEHSDARRVLNEARNALPAEQRIWIAAARLEEANSNADIVPKLVSRAIRSLRAHGVVIDRDYWIKSAYECESTNSPVTCQSIIDEVLGEGIEDIDKKMIWKKDAEAAAKLGKISTARAIYSKLLARSKHNSSMWWEAAMLEKKSGSADKLISLLEKAVKSCPRSEALWLLLSKEKWTKEKKTMNAKKVLRQALELNKRSEILCLAAVKLEYEDKNFDSARKLLRDCRAVTKSPRIWMKSALLERELGAFDNERNLLKNGVQFFKKSPKLWMMLGQSYQRSNDYSSARSTYKSASLKCRKSAPIRICAANLEIHCDEIAKGRSLLETARLEISGSVPLWLASIRLEEKCNEDDSVALRMLSRALQECPSSGELWAHAIEREDQPRKRGKCHDALKALSEDAHVYLAAAKLFWSERKINKSKNWFERAVKCDEDLGDAWGFYYAFLEKHGTTEQQRELEKRCVEANPRHGERWISVSKKVGNLGLAVNDILMKVSDGIKM